MLMIYVSQLTINMQTKNSLKTSLNKVWDVDLAFYVDKNGIV